MTALVKLCNKLPFDEVAIREIGIGKVIRKLLKFQSPSNGDVSTLRAQVEALMANWRAKQQELASSAKPSEVGVEAGQEKPPLGLVLAISDRLVRQRGLPSKQLDAKSSSASVDHNESKDDSAAHPTSQGLDGAMDVDLHSATYQHFAPSHSSPKSETVAHQNNFHAQASVVSANAPKPVSILSSLRAAQSAAAHDGDVASTGAVGDTTPAVLVIRPPVARERKPLDMAEKARSMLAMRAQHALSGAAGTASVLSGEPGSPTRVFGESTAPLSPSTSNVLSILSAVGKARIASGMQPVEQVYFYFLFVLVSQLVLH